MAAQPRRLKQRRRSKPCTVANRISSALRLP
jgi:hypothetical protein